MKSMNFDYTMVRPRKMRCPNCNAIMGEREFNFYINYYCHCGGFIQRSSIIHDVFVEASDFKIDGCEFKDLFANVKECYLCKDKNNKECQKLYETFLRNLDTQIIEGYELKRLKEKDVFELDDIGNLKEFRVIRQVAIDLEVELEGSFIHDDYGNRLNYKKIFKLKAWKGVSKTGSKLKYFLSDEQLNEFTRRFK